MAQKRKQNAPAQDGTGGKTLLTAAVLILCTGGGFFLGKILIDPQPDSKPAPPETKQIKPINSGEKYPAGVIPDDGQKTVPPAVIPVFTDVTETAGISFQHETGKTGRFYYPEVMGAGCAFFDYNGDGLLDIYFVNGNLLSPGVPSPDIRNALYRNGGDGTFTDATSDAGVGDSSYGQGCCAADYDGDGDCDLYVSNYGPNVLYQNSGDGTFTARGGVTADRGWGQACTFFDADGDGDLDLYLQNYLEYSIDKHQNWYVMIRGERMLDYCSPSGYRGQQDRLYRNKGDGSFEDITKASGILQPRGTGMGLLCADLDGDGDQDIAVSNDSRPNFYFQNNGEGVFTECALLHGFACNRQGGTEAFMGIAAGDYDGNMTLDLVIPCLRTEGFSLFHNTGTMFDDVSIETGLDSATTSVTGFAPVFLDYDSDGDLDLFFTTGEVRMGRTPVTSSTSFEDRYAMKDLLLENRNGRFVDISHHAGAPFQKAAISRACSAGDFDNDGDTDLVITAMHGKARLLRNDTKGGNWIGVALAGKPPNRDAVGAKLYLTSAAGTQFREITGAGSYLGQHDFRQLFGLGASNPKISLRIIWPGGKETHHTGLSINQYHTLSEQ